MHLYCKFIISQQHWHAAKPTHAHTPLHTLISCDSVVILSETELQFAVCLLYQPIMTAECKAGGNWNASSNLPPYCFEHNNVTWTALGQNAGICVLRPELLYTPNCHFTKILNISLVLNKLLIWLPSKCTVSMQISVSVNLCWHSGNYTPSLQGRCTIICIVLWFWCSYWWGWVERNLLRNDA